MIMLIYLYRQPQDSVSSIMDAGKDIANLFKRRCGVGLDLSDLRPKGDRDWETLSCGCR